MNKLLLQMMAVLSAFSLATSCKKSGSSQLSDTGPAQKCQVVTTIDLAMRVGGQELTRTVEVRETSDQTLPKAFQAYQEAIKAEVGAGELIRATRKVAAKCTSITQGFSLQGSATPGLVFVATSPIAGCQQIWNHEFQSWSCDDGTAMSFFPLANTAVIQTKKGEVEADFAANMQAVRDFLAQTNALASNAQKADQYSKVYYTNQEQYEASLAQFKANQAQTKSSEGVQAALKSINPQLKDYRLDQLLEKSIREELRRAEKFSGTANLSNLSASQLQAYNNKFIGGQKVLDKSILDNGYVGNKDLTQNINKYLSEYAALGGTSSDVRAGYDALLGVYTQGGVIIPQGQQNAELQNYLKDLKFSTSFDSPAIGDRRFAAQLRQDSNSLVNLLQEPQLLQGAIDHLKAADIAYASGDKERGQRLISQGQRLFQFRSDLRAPMGRGLVDIHHYRNRMENVTEDDLDSSDQVYEGRSNMIAFADLNMDLADSTLVANDPAAAQEYLGYARTALDLVTDFVPVVSAVKDTIVVVTGRNPITGEKVSDIERAVTAATLFVPSVVSGGTKAFTKVAAHLGDVVAAGGKSGKLAGQVLDGIKGADQKLDSWVGTGCVFGLRLMANCKPGEALESAWNELPEGRNPLFGGKLNDKQLGIEGNNLKVDSEGAAKAMLKKRGGIPRTLQPAKRWEAGSDVTRKGQPDYVYTTNELNMGKFWQYETDQGSRVIALHTRADIGAHGHVGGPKPGFPSRVDFQDADVRYEAVGGKHHIFWSE